MGRLDRQHLRREGVLEGMGCKVKITQIAEIPVYQAMADGKVDAVLEDWQHVDQYKQYTTSRRRSWPVARTASPGTSGGTSRGT